MRRVLPVLFVVFCGCLAAGGCDGHGERRAARPDRPIALSSLEGRIVFARDDDVWSANADGSDQRRLTRGHGPEFDPSWSPDGRRIAYRDSRRGMNVNDEIYVMDAYGSHRRNLTRSPANEWSPSWSPDGSAIAYYSGQLFTMRPDGSHTRQMTQVEGEYPAWSPDGKRIAYTTTDGARSDFALWVMNADGSSKRPIVTRRSAAFAVWAPDGKTIMFSGTGARGTDRLWVVRPDGSGLRQLPVEGWLPDWRR